MVMIRQEDVTIIIPHLGATPQQVSSLGFCLDSIYETYPDMRVIVVKNSGEPDENYSYLHQLHQNCVWINLEDQGQCKAVNAAAATVSTPWIMISNDDMIYAEGWFEQLIKPLGMIYVDNKYVDMDEFSPHSIVRTSDVTRVKYENILCISPQLIEPIDGAPTFKKFFAGGAGGDFNKDAWLGYAKNHVGGFIRTGFNLPFLIRKDVWDLVGGYDVNYDPWGSNSDSDLEYKLKLAGVQPFQNVDCPVYHFSQTSGTFEPRNRPSWEKNWQYFIDKWGFPRTDDGIWQATFMIPSKEEGRKFQPWWEGFYAK